MTDISFDVIAFDLDGTLADTAPDLAASLNHVLVKLGRDTIAPESVRHLVGHGGRALLRKGLAETGDVSEELIEQGFPLFIEHYAANICNGTKAYPGLDSALNSLLRSGTALAICTNKPEALARQLITALGWENHFQGIVGADTLAVKKPDPAPLHEAITRAGGGRAVYVGDSIIDAKTARAANVPFIAVSFGFSDRPVEELAADIIINNYTELADALMQLDKI